MSMRYGPGGLSPDVKQAIADEVQRDLSQEGTESQTPQGPGGPDAPPFADNGSHTFLVAANLEVNTADGQQQCPLTSGDVLGMNGGDLQAGATVAAVRVMASKGQDCQIGSMVAVSLDDLQEMQNRMRELIDQGLGELQSNQGRNGLPVVPTQARGQVQSPIAQAAPQADPNAGTELNEQDRLANQAEQEVVSQASEPMPQPAMTGAPAPVSGASNAAPGPAVQATPITISMGQTTDQVIGLLGQPKQIVDLGAKKMFVYDTMKIIFMDGKVSDVQ
jgi:hypothetical protein